MLAKLFSLLCLFVLLALLVCYLKFTGVGALDPAAVTIAEWIPIALLSVLILIAGLFYVRRVA